MKWIIVTITTFILFTLEAIIHYNIGRSKGDTKFKLYLPTFSEMLKISGTVLIFSILNGCITHMIGL